MKEIFVTCFLLIGVIFCAIASFGIVKFPDVYTRMHASSKSGALGVGCIILAVGLHFWTATIAVESTLTFLFFVMTAPVAAHAIARAAHLNGEPLWEGSVVDESRSKCGEESDS